MQRRVEFCCGFIQSFGCSHVVAVVDSSVAVACGFEWLDSISPLKSIKRKQKPATCYATPHYTVSRLQTLVSSVKPPSLAHGFLFLYFFSLSLSLSHSLPIFLSYNSSPFSFGRIEPSRPWGPSGLSQWPFQRIKVFAGSCVSFCW